MDLGAFINGWRTNTKGNERANKDSFIRELCAVLNTPPPPQKTGNRDQDTYVFEADILSVKEGGKTTVLKADLYKRGCFLLEAKQGSTVKGAGIQRETPAWHQMMQDARGQAAAYVRSIDDPPPFIVTCDIGYAFDLYADFDRTGYYAPFPNAQKSRIYLERLAEHLDTLRAIFLDPRSLDPSIAKIKVTRTVAEHIAQVAGYLEKAKHPPEAIAKFLMRCLFTMFAEDVDLLPDKLFTKAIEKIWMPEPDKFKRGVENLWAAMNTGGFSGAGDVILRFNGGLFADPFALPLGPDGLRFLLEAANCDWSDVEPAIFGTLLERALSKKERHKLGAHFTPRAYVERLVRPTVEDPVRTEWENVRAAASKLQMDGSIEGARRAVHAFHEKLCHTRVLDPACGTGNFLYVTLNIFKQIESEVLALLANLGEKQELLVRVSPKQFLGIEKKPWAKEIAELVLWIGYLQWHYRTHGKGVLPPEPVLQDFQNIECRDAVLTYDEPELVRDGRGKPVTRWDGETYKRNPVTGEKVPDEKATVQVEHYVRPRKAEWLRADDIVDYIVGNPPFLGKLHVLTLFGEGYVDALRKVYEGEVPDSADYVMYWWSQAADLARAGKIKRFGFVTTKSIAQAFNRRVVARALGAQPPLHLDYAIPNHPWIDAGDCAQVRIAMTVASGGDGDGQLANVVTESSIAEDGTSDVVLSTKVGKINADLRNGVSTLRTRPLRANEGMSSNGVMLGNRGFLIEPGKALQGSERFIKPILNGNDLLKVSRNLRIIDFFGLTQEQAQSRAPKAFQQLLDRVKPQRDHNRRPGRRDRWWLFAETMPQLRRVLAGLTRFIATPETSRHRVFLFVKGDTLPEHKLVAIGSVDAHVLGVLSSRVHVVWAMATGGRLGVGNDSVYNKTLCFDPFPFPEHADASAARIRSIAEGLDAHRSARRIEHPDLTISQMYSTMEKVAAGAELTDKDRDIHERGLVSILKKIHDDLDAAVFEAYGWPTDLTDEQILEKLVALNAERAEEEKKGTIRWLRPDYQNPTGQKAATQEELLPLEEAEEEAPPPSQVKAWPKKLADQVVAVRALVAEPGKVFSLANVAAGFKGAKKKDVEGILDSIAGLGLLTVFQTAAGKRWRAAGKATD
jgi:hypothetical protein